MYTQMVSLGMKISLNFPDTLLTKMDEYCAKHDYERSEFVRSLVRGAIEGISVYPKDISPPAPQEKGPIQEVPVPKIPENKIIEGWCQLHFEKNARYPLKEITWEDENGIPVVDHKWACPRCIEKYENMGRGVVSYFI